MEPMLLALDTTLPLWVLSTKSPGRKRPQSPMDTMASNADLSPSTPKLATTGHPLHAAMLLFLVSTLPTGPIPGSQGGIWMQ